MKKGHFANYAQNWLQWQRLLGNWKRRSRSIIYKQIPIICEKNAKIGPVDPEMICLRVIIKKEKREINASKISSLCPVSKFAK